MSLTGPQKLEWQKALADAFDPYEFGELLLGLNDKISHYVTPERSIDQVILKTIEKYDSRGEEKNLFSAALAARPNKGQIVDLARAFGATSVPKRNALETIIQQSNSLLDFGVWLEKAVKIEQAVCRIEIPLHDGGTAFGTGFLISPDLLVTNFHVVKPLLGAEDHVKQAVPLAAPNDVICRFDYRVFSDGTRSAGTTYRLAANWKVFLSRNNDENEEPTLETLDCAVLRLARPAGDLAVGSNPEGTGTHRGWIELPTGEIPSLLPHRPMFIVQHPQAEPIKLALDTDAIESVNPSRTRVRYRTNTEPGSSGSPCFDQDWKLAALHHSGDPNFVHHTNEGVPIECIIKSLREKNIIR